MCPSSVVSQVMSNQILYHQRTHYNTKMFNNQQGGKLYRVQLTCFKWGCNIFTFLSKIMVEFSVRHVTSTMCILVSKV